MTPEDSVPADEGTMHLKLPPHDAPPMDAASLPDEGTVRLGNVPEQPERGTVRLGNVPPQADQGTVRLGGVPPLAPEPEPVGYIASVMAASAAEEAVAAPAVQAAPAADPGLIRFGPGVPDPKTARTIAVWKGQAAPEAAAQPTEERKKRAWLFWVPVLLVFLALLAWWLLRFLTPSTVGLTGASITVEPTAVTCNGKATITATVTTDGKAGSFQYHWLRSDGTDSGTLTETVASGTHQVELPLIWTLSGPGDFHGTATLLVLGHPAIKPSTSFDYSCTSG
ncbi:SprB repeat-containing protein [Streptacidiphilus rugosus]|uniref:SprB repeat-containing protein n=1 Tax=Streptacidiphilus rugosus TaxID=405783 RepID=UPI00068BC07B|nr:SprB repeat-containing protein [Streptacidiphilus rugosus]